MLRNSKAFYLLLVEVFNLAIFISLAFHKVLDD